MLVMAISRQNLRRQLESFELQMRVVAGTYVTTERFLKDFLGRAEKIYRSAAPEERQWVSDQIGHILNKFGFKIIDDDW